MGVLNNIDYHNYVLFVVVDAPESPLLTVASRNGLVFHDLHQKRSEIDVNVPTKLKFFTPCILHI